MYYVVPVESRHAHPAAAAVFFVLFFFVLFFFVSPRWSLVRSVVVDAPPNFSCPVAADHVGTELATDRLGVLLTRFIFPRSRNISEKFPRSRKIKGHRKSRKNYIS